MSTESPKIPALGIPRENLFQDGPYLLAAVLCERVLEEKDGVKSIIRMIDRITQTARGEEVPEQMPTLQYQTTMFLMIKPGNRPAKYDLRIDLLKPNGSRAPGARLSFDLDGPPNQGRDVVIRIALQLEQEGVHWFEVYLNGMLATRVPLQVVYIIQTRGKADQAPVM